MTWIFIVGQATRWTLHFSDALLFWYYTLFLETFHVPRGIRSKNKNGNECLNCGDSFWLGYSLTTKKSPE